MPTKQLTKLNRPNSIRYNGIVYHPVDLRQAADPSSATADDQAADDATLAVLELLGEAGASKDQLAKVKNEFPVDTPSKQDKSASAPAFIEIAGQLYKKAGGDKAKKNYAKALQMYEKAVNATLGKLTKVSNAMKPDPKLALVHKQYINVIKGALDQEKAGGDSAGTPWSWDTDILSIRYKNTVGEDAFYETLKKFFAATTLINKKQGELDSKLAEVAKKRGRKAPGSGTSKLGRMMLIGVLLGALFGGLGGSSSSTYSPSAPTQITQVSPKQQEAKKPKPGEPEYEAFEQARNAPPPG